MNSLLEHRVYDEILGRTFDPDEEPAPDVVTVGYIALAKGHRKSALGEFAELFLRCMLE